MYMSPIEVLISDIQHQIDKQYDEEIYKAVVSFGINVDKAELLRALQYDRGQYEKGYKDAKAELVYCRECDKPLCHMRTHMVHVLGIFEPFCAAGIRRIKEEVSETQKNG